MIKKLQLTILFIILISLPLIVKAGGFIDVNQGDWFYDEVMTTYDKNIINGFPNGYFLPNEFVTGEQFIKMLIIALDIKIEADTNNWAAPYLLKAEELSLIPNDIFISNNPIIRGDMARILDVILDYLQEEVEIINTSLYDLSVLTPDKYINSILTLYNAGIITGFPDHTFRYDQEMTRAQACAVINRLITPNQRQKLVATSGDHVSAYPFNILDLSPFYEVEFDLGRLYDVSPLEIIDGLAGHGGYLVIDEQPMANCNTLMIHYYGSEVLTSHREYSLFSLYCYDGLTGYPEAQWGYDTMSYKLVIKSLCKPSYDVYVSNTRDYFYDYKIKAMLSIVFGKEVGLVLSEQILSYYYNRDRQDIEYFDTKGISMFSFKTGNNTIGNYTFTIKEQP